MADFQAGRFRQRGRSSTAGHNRTNLFRIENVGFHSVPAAFAEISHAEVSSRPLQQTDETRLVHLYRDATTSVQLEKRIVESAKMAELGTIGSSIAHQLNNPIGGMLSHIQLLLMDLKTLDFEGRDELFSELREMESGTRRCAEIVRDLLGFSRRADEDEAHEHDLIEIVDQAMKITELQTRSRGIRFKMATNASEILISGRFNLLAQAVRAVLLSLLPKGLRDLTVNVSVLVKEAESSTLESEVSPPGVLPMTNRVEVEIGPVRRTEKNTSAAAGLDLSVAQQILSEHGGSLTGPASGLSSDSVNRAILSLPIRSWTRI
jgi:signal transduction histidine kinase